METAAFPGAIGVDRHLAGQPQGLLQPGVTMTPFHRENSKEVPGPGSPAGAWQSPWGPKPRPSGRLAQYLCSAWPAVPRSFGIELSLGSCRGLETGFSHMTQTTKDHHRYTGLHPHSKPLCFRGHQQESENTRSFLGVWWLGVGAVHCQGRGSTPTP